MMDEKGEKANRGEMAAEYLNEGIEKLLADLKKHHRMVVKGRDVDRTKLYSLKRLATLYSVYVTNMPEIDPDTRGLLRDRLDALSTYEGIVTSLGWLAEDGA